MLKNVPVRLLNCGGTELSMAALITEHTKLDPSKTVWVAVWPVGTDGGPKYRHLIQIESDAWCLRIATALCNLELQATAAWFIGELSVEVSLAQCPECRKRLDTMNVGTP